MITTSPPTLRDVAGAAGSSTSTVSEVLSGRTRYRSGAEIPPATIARVKAAAQELGYRKLTNAERWGTTRPPAYRVKCRPDDTTGTGISEAP